MKIATTAALVATAAALVAPPQRSRAPRTVTVYGLRDRLSGAFPKTTRVAKRIGDKFRRNRAEDDAAVAEAAAAAEEARKAAAVEEERRTAEADPSVID